MSITKEQLDEYIKAYNEGKPLIPDSTYDRLLEEYLQEHGENSRPYLRSKQSDGVNALVCTLPKAFGVITSMREGMLTYEQWFNRKNINPKAKVVIQPKFDGCSVACDANLGFFTRGDYENGESVDVTELFKPYYHGPHHEALDGIKFEAIISKEVFSGLDLQKRYLTPRDAVSGIISSRNYELSKFITLVPLRVLIDDKEFVCNKLEEISIVSTTADDFDTIQQFITDKLNDGANVVFGNNNEHFAIDGVVVSVLNEDGSTNEEIAIKILNDINETKLIRVEYQFGKTGKITPVAIVEPTSFCDGKRTVDHITLSTLERVKDMGLKQNDTVRIMYNIVPYFLESLHDGDFPIQIPDKCPICGAPFDMRTLKQVRCTNPNCSGLKIGAIVRYATQMKMFGISEMTISKLFEYKLISNISDLYKLTIQDICKLPGFKETSANNIVTSIRKASRDIPVHRWLGALPFKDVSAKTWDLILLAFVGNDEMKRGNLIKQYLEKDSNEFIIDLMSKHIPGVGVATRRAINEGWLSNFDEIKEICKYVSFKITTVSNVMNSKGRVTLTGTRDKDMIKYLTEHGYEIGDFSTQTKYVIIPNDSFVSNKTVKATKMGIPVYTIEQAYEALS